MSCEEFWARGRGLSLEASLGGLCVLGDGRWVLVRAVRIGVRPGFEAPCLRGESSPKSKAQLEC